MILALKAFGEDKIIRSFFCSIDNLESVFEILRLLILQGNTVFEAEVIDEDGCVKLPTHIFDDQSVRGPVQSLEKQWQNVLNKPIGRGSVHNIELRATTRRLMAVNKSQLDHVAICLARLSDLQQRARKTAGDKELKVRIIARYQGLMDTLCDTAVRLEAYQQMNRRSMERLEK